MSRFTDEQYREICEARERGRLFFEQIHRYPQEPEQVASSPAQPPEPEWAGFPQHYHNRTRTLLVDLQTRLNEHLDKSKKRGKY